MSQRSGSEENSGPEDMGSRDKKDSRTLAIILLCLVAALLIGLALLIPAFGELIAVHFAPGLGLRSAAVVAFFVTVGLMIVFALVSGDGLLGEIQFVLGGFFLFYLFFWLMIAWIF